jgi:hypothetical protein
VVETTLVDEFFEEVDVGFSEFFLVTKGEETA